MQVIGDINHAEVRGMVDDVGYLLNDAGLPVDDGQVLWPRDWGVRLWPRKLSNLLCFTLTTPPPP